MTVVISDITDKHVSPFQLLLINALIENDGFVLRDKLIETVYPNPDTSPDNETRSIATQICLLNRKLLPDVLIKYSPGPAYVLLGVDGIKAVSPLPVISPPPPNYVRIIIEALMDGRPHSIPYLIERIYEWREPPPSVYSIIMTFIHYAKNYLKPDWKIRNLNKAGGRSMKASYILERCTSDEVNT